MILFLVFMCVGNLCMVVSCMNHWAFANVNFSEKSFTSAFVMCACLLDGSFLNLLAEDTTAIAEIKRAAIFVSLATWFGPALVLQVIMEFMLNVDWQVYEYMNGGGDWTVVDCGGHAEAATLQGQRC